MDSHILLKNKQTKLNTFHDI